MSNLQNLQPTSPQQAVLAGLELLRRRREPIAKAQRAALDLLLWNIMHRPQLKPGLAFDLAGRAYLGDIYSESARRLVLMKAAQLGVSEYAVSYVLHACDMRRATCLYIFPTDGAVSDFSSARIGPAIECSPYLQRIVVDGSGSGKRGADRVTLKRIRDRFLYLRGGQVTPDGRAPQLKSIDADVVVYDEVDELDPRALALGQKRLGASTIAEERLISTPSYDGTGIDAEYKASDMRRWHVPCPSCGKRQVMSLDNLVIESDQLGRPVRWHGQDEGRAWLACGHCHKPLDRFAAGEWVATWPGRDSHGYHLTKFPSPTFEPAQLVLGLQTTDESKRKELINQDLGATYTPRGGRLTDAILDNCCGDFAHGPVADADKRMWTETVMGIDVNLMLNVVVRARNPATGVSRQLWAGEATWDDIDLHMLRFKPKAVVIDALPETTKARELQARHEPGRVWLSYYVMHSTGTKKTQPWDWKWNEHVVDIDRTRALDQMFGGFYAGTARLPGHARDITNYYDQMKASVRVVENSAHGLPVARYVESGADHFAHAENYCNAAFHAHVDSGWVEYANKELEKQAHANTN